MVGKKSKWYYFVWVIFLIGKWTKVLFFSDEYYFYAHIDLMSQPAEEKVLRLYADGVFDGFHIGHSNMLKQCREAFPGKKVWLIAGVCDQHDVEIFKGPTISTE